MKITDLIGRGGEPTPVSEYTAEGEMETVFHEIRQCLRVTGVNLVFRTWAAFPKFFPLMWKELRPNVVTTAFEDAADQIREEATRWAEEKGMDEGSRQEGRPMVVGESRAYQIRAALDLYHYINPKLLVLTAAVSQALRGEHIGNAAGAGTGIIPCGEPAKMFPMEMEEEKPEARTVHRIFKDIRRTLSLSRISSDYRTLALWPDYLGLVWNRLKPICQSEGYRQASDQLREQARGLARSLPYPISLTLGRIRGLGEDPEAVKATTETFERILPGLILNMALLESNWKRREEETRSKAEQEREMSGQRSDRATANMTAGTLAAEEGAEPIWRVFQKRQRVVELGDRFVSYIDEGQGEPVVLLHGIPTWGLLWERTIAALNNRYRVLVPDLLGYGYSEKRDCFDRSIERQAQMLDGFLDKLGVDSAHFIGHDIGGGVALRCATLLGHRVRSLCLMNSVCYDSWPVEVMLQLGQPSGRRMLSGSKFWKGLRQGLERMGFQRAPEAGWMDSLLSPWRTEVGKLSLIRNAAALDTNQTTEITRLLPAITVPTLVLWGEDDSFQPVKYGEWLAKDIPGASLVRIAGARHFVMVDQPERVHGALHEFLGRQGAVQAKRAA